MRDTQKKLVLPEDDAVMMERLRQRSVDLECGFEPDPDTEICREQVCIACCEQPATTKSEGVGWPVCESCAAQEATAIQNK